MNPNYISALPASVPFMLTPLDVERLLTDDSERSRTHVLEAIAVHYNNDEFEGRERDIAEQVFRLLMKDVALCVREMLADRIKDNANIPRDIVLFMANDVESVAAPLLHTSKVLSDADLVDIIEKSSEMGKLLAITKRETISTRVSEALVETHYAPVMTSLLANEGATISERSYEKIAEDFLNDAEVINALARSPKLPMAIVERIITRISDTAAAELRQKYQMDDAQAKRDANHIREDFMVRLLEHDVSHDEVAALVAQMAREERLTPSIVMTALCRGQLLFFTMAMAQFAGIPHANAERLIADRGMHAFQGLYTKSQLPDSMMDAVHLLLRTVQDMAGDDAIPGSMLYANRLVERVIAATGNQQIEYLPYFIALIRQNQQRS